MTTTTRIRVDPSSLRQSARLCRQMAGQLELAERSLASTAIHAPSYDSQFKPAIAAIGAGSQARLRAFQRRLEGHAAQLESLATAFEAADLAGVQGLAAIGAAFQTLFEAYHHFLDSFQTDDPPEDPIPDSLSLEDFYAMSVEERLAWVRAMNAEYGEGWFYNFIDLISYLGASCFFNNLDRSTAAGEWMAWGDAAVIQVVQDGYLLYLNSSAELPPLPPGTPQAISVHRQEAAELWQKFFYKLDTEPEKQNELLHLWGTAEQAGVNYGSDFADWQLEQQNIELSDQEVQTIDLFVRVGNVYRGAMAQNLGPYVLPEAPEVFGAEIGEGIAETAFGHILASHAQDLNQIHQAVNFLAGEEAAQDVLQFGNTLLQAETEVFTIAENTAEGLGGWVGEQWGNLLEEGLQTTGDWFFDPTLHVNPSVEIDTSVFDVNVNTEVRGPVYFMALGVEELILDGHTEIAERFVEAIETSLEIAATGIAP